MSSKEAVPPRPPRRQKNDKPELQLSAEERKDVLEKLSYNTSTQAAKAESKWKRTAIFKNNKPLKDTTPINAPAWLVFGLLAAFNSIAAIYSPILDCDEVFNYWEPSHYLNHGHGFETWEYSPEFAIRSWAYAGIHALLTLPGRLIPGTSRASEFYTLRILLGMLCAFCQTYAYLKVARIMSPKIGQYFVLVCLTSPGFFFASVSYLPSSSAAYMTLMAVAEFIDWRGGAHTAEGITWFGVASVVAWPFAGILIVPFIAEDILVASITDTIMDAGQLWIYGITRTALAGVLVFFVDLAMYRKYVCVAFNIVWYNILARTVGKGPNIFGVEPWHYYFRNLILNFHVWFVLAVLALPAIYYQQRVVHKACNRLSYIRNLTIATPLYLWLAIFSLQPHKEERFMYPAYPLIAINAAQTIHLALMWLGNAKKSNVAPSVSAKTRLAFVGACLIGALAWSGLRIAGIVNAYGAPLSIYKPLHGPVQTTPGDTVCLGKEWYRFPSHYHLPAGVKAKFIKSDFDGLLPGEFSQASTGFGLFPGAWLIPPGMNDRNIEDPGKHVDLDACTYLVDSHLPSTRPTELEPDYINDEENWSKIKCEPFLDASSTSFLGRVFWVPDWPSVPHALRRQWGEYCLLERKRSLPKSE